MIQNHHRIITIPTSACETCAQTAESTLTRQLAGVGSFKCRNERFAAGALFIPYILVVNNGWEEGCSGCCVARPRDPV